MNGIELAEKFYDRFGKPMLEEKFPHLKDKIAVGVAGGGSDSYGFDDETSRDHDYEAGFCIFLPGEEVVSRRDEFLLERAYAALPKRFMGVERPPLSPVGGNRRGVLRIADFFMRLTGDANGNPGEIALLTLPEHYLFEATDGKVFYDGYGLFGEIRDRLKNPPVDVRLKKTAGNILMMHQAGLYNYARCAARGDEGACQLSIVKFVDSALNASFALNDAYKPYYKWSFHAYRKLKKPPFGAERAEFLLTTANTRDLVGTKTEVINEIAALTADAAAEKYGVERRGDNLVEFAYALNDAIKSEKLRNLNIFAGV